MTALTPRPKSHAGSPSRGCLRTRDGSRPEGGKSGPRTAYSHRRCRLGCPDHSALAVKDSCLPWPDPMLAGRSMEGYPRSMVVHEPSSSDTTPMDLPAEIVAILAVFAPLFSACVWTKAQA